MEKVKFITIDPKDNVATALANAEKDQIAQITDELKIKLLEPIAAGHKIAIKPIRIIFRSNNSNSYCTTYKEY